MRFFRDAPFGAKRFRNPAMIANPAKTPLGALFAGHTRARISAAEPKLKGSLTILVGEKP
jgi:hypothetical protein